MKCIYLCLSIALFCNPLAAQKHQRPPNVIIVFIDDMGYGDIGCFGAADIKTPHIDQLAREGARLTHFYSAQPVCSAARAALLTGCYPNRIGIHQALMPDSKIGLNPEETTIADMLHGQDYRTALFGKWHLGDSPECMPNRQGFDEYWGIPYSNDMWPNHPQQGKNFNFKPLHVYQNGKQKNVLTEQSMLTTQIAEHSVHFIKKNRKKPFLMYVAHPMPHVPLFVSDKFKGKSGRGLYGDVVMELDWAMGEILNALKKYKLEENTLVIFTSDNGPWLAYGNHAGNAGPLREGKGTVWEGGVREPCLIRLPGKIAPGTVVETPLMTIDLLPTIAALTGSPLPSRQIDGKNILPLLTGQKQDTPHEALFFYYNVNELQAVRYGDWKMYFPHTYQTLNGGFPGKDGQPGQYKYVKITTPELYNLATDEKEQYNVAAGHPEIMETITKIADAMRAELGDALTQKKGSANREPWRRQ